MTDRATRVAPPHAPLLRRAAAALLGYAAIRALGLAVLAVWSAARGKDAYTLLTARWDALWYARIAELGYGYEVRLPNGDVHSDLAFFPLLPWLERLLHALAPLSYADAGFLVSVLASLAAACGIFAVADRLHGPRTGVLAVLLWAALPVGVVQSMAYSESLFTALAAWSLYAVLTGRWLSAGALAALAGLTRPVGLAVVAAVWTAGVVSFVRERSTKRTPGAQRSEHAFAARRGAPDSAHAPGASSLPRAPARTPGTARVPQAPGARPLPHAPTAANPPAPDASSVAHIPQAPAATPPDAPARRRVLGMLLAPLGAAGHVLWVGQRTGKGPLGYLDVQAGWRNGFDGGYAFARFTADKFTSFPSALAGLGLIAGVALLIRLYAACVRARQPAEVLVYTGVVLALALCASGYFGSKPRLLMPAFPVLLPLARALARLRPSRSALVTAGLAVTAAAYGAFWLNGSGPP
ncbi:glycosyltransferase family 39 protein [Streptomyces sp. NPDC006193]|uniref:glycosyltransferase family 39 protein n=1 Tax=Streptomyces sp. NPDC006193 TaxID=3155717 RepID=UPI0033BB7C12